MEKEKLREIVKKAVSDSWHIGNAFDPIEDQTEHITEALHQALSMSGVSDELFCSCGKPSKMPLCFDCFKGNLDEIDPQNNYH